MELDRALIDRLVAAWLEEDLGRGDVTSRAVGGSRHVIARLEAREGLVVAGMDIAAACFKHLGAGWNGTAKDGEVVDAGTVLAHVEGNLAAVLGAERTALNILGRLCGVATLTARFVEAIGSTGTRIVDTRKTTPGLRVVEKYAVAVGGGTNHRFGLDDAILIKDNHVSAAGGVRQAIRGVRENAPFGMKIEVEVSDTDQLLDALDEGADIVLLDNMSPEQVRSALEDVAGRTLIEVSGGITLDNVKAYAMPGVDFISVGALTHSAPNADVALEVEV
ncbi:MAG: carboxylating nicotinate-nucleotide diphosphorylase [Actinomycetota bacterium]|nr:carboxylating nicotinate-nucleotide diphosphorylase [Actinomycetota bacterium]